MDHHCIFMDNCVGTYTIKYFIQYTCWTLISLIWAICNFFRCIYNQNVYNNEGVQGVSQLRPQILFTWLLIPYKKFLDYTGILEYTGTLKPFL